MECLTHPSFSVIYDAPGGTQFWGCTADAAAVPTGVALDGAPTVNRFVEAYPQRELVRKAQGILNPMNTKSCRTVFSFSCCTSNMSILQVRKSVVHTWSHLWCFVSSTAVSITAAVS